MINKKTFQLKYKEALKLQKNLCDASSFDQLRNGVIIRIGTDDLLTLYATDGQVMGRLRKEKDENQAAIPFADMEIAFAVDIKPLEKLTKYIDEKEDILCTYEESEEADENENRECFVTFHMNSTKEIIKLRAKQVKEDILEKIDNYLNEDNYTSDFEISRIITNTKKMSKVAFNESIMFQVNKNLGEPRYNEEGVQIGEETPIFLIKTRDKEYTGVILAKHDKIGEDNPPEEEKSESKDEPLPFEDDLEELVTKQVEKNKIVKKILAKDE